MNHPQKTAYKVLRLRLLKLLHIVLMTLPFAIAWGGAYVHSGHASMAGAAGAAVTLVFLVLYVLFTRVYGAFFISQSRISELNYQMDSYKSQLRKYDDLISYCTVHIYVNEVWRESVPNARTITFGERIVLGLKDNLKDIGEGFENFAVWFVTSLPYLLIWAVVIAAAVLIIRAIVKRHKKKKEQKLIDAYIRSRENENNTQKTDENT